MDMGGEVVDRIDSFVDSDLGGDKRTRKSTSGGVVMIAGGIIESWSKTQGPVALSSGEAEYYSMVRGTVEGIRLQILARIPFLLAQALRTSYHFSDSTKTIYATSYSNAMLSQASLAAPFLSTTSRPVFRSLLAKLLATFCAAWEFNTDFNLA